MTTKKKAEAPTDPIIDDVEADQAEPFTDDEVTLAPEAAPLPPLYAVYDLDHERYIGQAGTDKDKLQANAETRAKTTGRRYELREVR